MYTSFTLLSLNNPKIKVMRKFYLPFLFLLCSVSLFAKDVDQAYAMQVAKNFILQNSERTEGNLTLSLAYNLTTNTNVGRISDGKPVYYAFNINGGGFVIVAGDDLVEPVLAYSFESDITKETQNPAVVKWLDNYAKQIVYVKENINETTDVITQLWHDYYYNLIPQHIGSRGTQAVNPLCQTKWNQAPNENGQCPYDNAYNERCVTGCVATAMAQVMKYWNFPTQGTGFHSYNDQNYGSQSANFGSTTYQWSSMPNVLGSANSAVATLMYHCGVGVEMHYGVGATGGSSAYVVASLSPGQACAEYAYKTYFGYDPATVQGIVRQNYSDANWISTLKTELDNSRPIQYAGIGNGGGHTWVCDGYDQNDFFHMNWGWGGNSDGYFSVDNLDPTSLGAGGGTGGFNGNQQAVIGIKPVNGGGGGGGGGGTINQDSIILYAQTTVSANPVQTGSSFSVYATIANAGAADFTGDFAAALFDNNGVFVDFIQEFTGQTAQAGFYYNVTFTANSLSAIPGNYIVGIFYKNGSNNYSLINPAGYNNPISITITGPANSIQMYSNTTFNPTTLTKSQSFTIDNQMANAGGSTFTGWLSADLFKLDGTYVTNIEEIASVSMAAGNYYNVQFVSNGLNVDPGTYLVAFFSSPDHNTWTLVYSQSYPNPVEVTIVDVPVTPDVYENNNTSAAAYALNVNFSGNTAVVNTAGTNMHVGNDYDYFKVNLPSGTNYSINARIHDSYSSGNGNNYTNDAQFSYMVNGGNWSDAFDDVLPGPIYVQGGGTVIFFVADYFTGTTGTYLLDMGITRGQNVGIEEAEANTLSVFPNPTRNKLFIDAGKAEGTYELSIYNAVGELVKSSIGSANGELINTNVADLAAGMYAIHLKTASGVLQSKFIVE